MKLRVLARGLLALGLLGLGMLVAVPAALADGGPHNQDATSGGSTFGGEVCASCHRAHTGAGLGLGSSDARRDVCYACHGTTAQGSSLDVSDGVMASSRSGLKSGGFDFALMDTAWTGSAAFRPVTSVHGDKGEVAAIWGSGEVGSGAGAATVDLTCVSCHDPHGNGNYRILRPIPVGSTATTEVRVPDEGTKEYTVSSTLNRYFGQVYMKANYPAEVSLDEWCAACHNRYDAPSQDASYVSSGDPIYTYRHGTRMVDPESGNCTSCHKKTESGVGEALNILGITQVTAHVPVCENCHVAHGTAAQMGEINGSLTLPDGSAPPAGTMTSTLLRLDNRGVCRACHGK